MYVKVYQRGPKGNDRYEVLLNTDQIVAIQRCSESNNYEIITTSQHSFFVTEKDMEKVYVALPNEVRL